MVLVDNNIGQGDTFLEDSCSIVYQPKVHSPRGMDSYKVFRYVRKGPLRFIMILLLAWVCYAIFFTQETLTSKQQHVIDSSLVVGINELKNSTCMLEESVCTFIKQTRKEYLWYHTKRYAYVINEPCDHANGPYLLVLVISDPRESNARWMMRETTGRVRAYDGKRIRTVFIVGRTENASIERNITLESARHRDIIKIAFEDSYKNYTLKTLLAFRWTIEHCAYTKYVLRCGHDVTAQYKEIVRYIRQLPKRLATKLFAGFLVRRGSYVFRDPGSKWYQTWEEFSQTSYPEYITGFASLFSYDVIRRLHNASLWKHLFVEDVFMSTVATENNITLTHNPNFWPYRPFGILQRPCCLLKSLAIHKAPTFRVWSILNGNVTKTEACRRQGCIETPTLVHWINMPNKTTFKVLGVEEGMKRGILVGARSLTGH